MGAFHFPVHSLWTLLQRFIAQSGGEDNAGCVFCSTDRVGFGVGVLHSDGDEKQPKTKRREDRDKGREGGRGVEGEMMMMEYELYIMMRK